MNVANEDEALWPVVVLGARRRPNDGSLDVM